MPAGNKDRNRAKSGDLNNPPNNPHNKPTAVAVPVVPHAEKPQQFQRPEKGGPKVAISSAEGGAGVIAKPVTILARPKSAAPSDSASSSR